MISEGLRITFLYYVSISLSRSLRILARIRCVMREKDFHFPIVGSFPFEAKLVSSELS